MGNLISLGSNITTGGSCSHEIKKKRLLLGRKAMMDLHGILGSKDYFVNKDLSCQSYGFIWM